MAVRQLLELVSGTVSTSFLARLSAALKAFQEG
jgi:hypothetical protein